MGDTSVAEYILGLLPLFIAFLNRLNDQLYRGHFLSCASSDLIRHRKKKHGDNSMSGKSRVRAYLVIVAEIVLRDKQWNKEIMNFILSTCHLLGFILPYR